MNKKKHISVVSILSIIMFALSIIVPGILLVLCIIGASNTTSVGESQGYGWGIIILLFAGVMAAGYYLLVMAISLVLDFKTNSKIGKNICIPIALLLPFIFLGITMLFSFVSENQKNYSVGDLKVEFPKEMKRSGYGTDVYTGGYRILTFFDRWEDSSTCAITIVYGKYDSSKSAIGNMKETADDEFIDKDYTITDFLENSYSTNQRSINGTTWNYLNYTHNTKEYFRIYGTANNSKYYVIQVKDDHTNHSKCKEYEEQFVSKLEFK